MPERTTTIVDDDDRPTISAARLEELFGGLRSELSAGLPMLPSAEVVRRARRRRHRRRSTALAATAVLAIAGLWGSTLLPVGGRGSTVLSGPAPEQTLAPTLELPGPWQPQRPTVTGIDPAVGQLLLPVDRLPSVPELYGPWREQDATPVPSPPEPSCVPSAVEKVGAVRQWEVDYADAADHGARARQYVLEFASELAADQTGTLLMTAANCTSPERGWSVEDRTPTAAALRLPRPAPQLNVVEEVATRVVGKRLVVLLVQRTGEGVVTVRPEFRAAAQELDRTAAGTS